MNLKEKTGLIDLLPSEFYLSQNYPNPFSEKTTIKFCLAYKTKVKLEVFDSGDKLIRTLLDEEKEAGTYEIELWGEARNLSEGIYVYRLQARDYTSAKKMTVLR